MEDGEEGVYFGYFLGKNPLENCPINMLTLMRRNGLRNANVGGGGQN